MPFFLWLRFLAGQKLQELHRRHLGVKMRDANREVSLYRGGLPEATSASRKRAVAAGRRGLREKRTIMLATRPGPECRRRSAIACPWRDYLDK